MLSQKQLKWFEELTQIDGVSGHERNVAQYLKHEYEAHGLEIIFDNLGSIMACKRSTAESPLKVMILGHMDEIGFLVKDVTETGGLKIHPVGGWFAQTLLAQRVKVTTRDNTVYRGTIGSIPPHLLSLDKRNKPMAIADMLVDVGAKNKQEISDLGIQIGDMVVVSGSFTPLAGGHRILSKAFDNRYGCVLGLDILDHFKDAHLDFDLYVGASVQEEVGVRGATTITQLIQPDFAVVLDCSPANDAADPSAIGTLGGGVLIRMMDGNMIADKKIIAQLVNVCQEYGIKHQYYFSPGGTDAGAVHKSLCGVKTLTCCICARNIHTSSTIMDVQDYLGAKEALVHLLQNKKWSDQIG